MNCKPGDLARIVHPDMLGKLVQVHVLIRSIGHRHPDGQRALYSCVGCWEIESLGAPFPVMRVRQGGGTYLTTSRFASCEDKWLRPVRDSDGDDETLTWAGKPEKVEA